MKRGPLGCAAVEVDAGVVCSTMNSGWAACRCSSAGEDLHAPFPADGTACRRAMSNASRIWCVTTIDVACSRSRSLTNVVVHGCGNDRVQACDKKIKRAEGVASTPSRGRWQPAATS